MPGITVDPTALTATRAPTWRPLSVTAEALPCSPFQDSGTGAETGAGVAQFKMLRRRLDRTVTQIRVGRLPAPGLVAAVCEVEEDGRGHHRNPAG